MENLNKDNKNNYKDVDQSDFMSEVINASKDSLIVVDFWAPWCGPCKDLGPKIEKVVGESNGKAKLVKINIDNNQELAGQLQIQSIPTVYAFKNGKIANAFQGAQPESEIRKFLENALGEKLQGNYEQQILLARDLLNQEKYNESINIVEDIISSGDNDEAIEILIKNNLGLNKLNEVKTIIESLEEKTKKQDSIKSAINAYNLLLNSKKDGSIEELIASVENDPLNIINNKKLSDLYFANKQYDQAFDLMLNLFIKSKKEKRVEIKKILFSYFDLLGNTHIKTKEFRRRLSSIIYS